MKCSKIGIVLVSFLTLLHNTGCFQAETDNPMDPEKPSGLLLSLGSSGGQQALQSLLISGYPASLREGESGHLRLVMNGPVGGTTTVEVASSSSSLLVANAANTQVQFSAADATTEKLISLHAPQDDNATSEEVTLSIRHGSSLRTVSIAIEDDDEQAILLVAPSLVREGESSDLQISLQARPEASVEVSIASGDPALEPHPHTLTFLPENYATAQTVSLVAPADANQVSERVSLQISSGGLAETAWVEVIDSDAAIVQISSGMHHNCALYATGTIRCWGNNEFGQLGYGNTTNIDTVTAVGTVEAGANIKQVLAVGHVTCVAYQNGTVRCWGNNDYGELGQGDTVHRGLTPETRPLHIPLINIGGTVDRLSGGYDHICALLTNGKVRCWGKGTDLGYLGYNGTNHVGDDELPAEVGDINIGGTAVDIVSGGYHSCVLLDTKRMRCWGRGQHGRLGYGHTISVGTLYEPWEAGDVPLDNVVSMAAGDNHTCASTASGQLYCWGFNSYGGLGRGNYEHLGDNEAITAHGPLALGSDVPVSSVSAGFGHTCAVLDNGQAKCWGWDFLGQLGDGGDYDPLPSAQVAPFLDAGSSFRKITAGFAHTCGLLSSGRVRCWGNHAWSALGIGPATHDPYPDASTVPDLDLAWTHIRQAFLLALRFLTAG
ncbi:MAG: hypothetical protein HS115_00985 [Spirochaetales bacterium]|nr:hypothetical protein [Spirochaetales bacterium]